VDIDPVIVGAVIGVWLFNTFGNDRCQQIQPLQPVGCRIRGCPATHVVPPQFPAELDGSVKSSSIVLLISGESTMNQFSKFLSAAFLAVTLVSVVGCASTTSTEGTGEYIDDSVITTKVKAAIFNEPTLKSAEINVETFKGVVQLGGFVNSQADINKAAEIARSVKGVTSVKNDMRLK
jgi:hyperosmotically inducible protein